MSFFQVGRGTWSKSYVPPWEGRTVGVGFGMYREDAPPQAWTYLVTLSRQCLEPRLVTEIVARVRRGETVTVCNGDLRVAQSGIGCSKPPVSLPWESVGGAQPYGGRVWIYQAGVENPVWSVEQDYPNAVLVPALVTALSRDAASAG